MNISKKRIIKAVSLFILLLILFTGTAAASSVDYYASMNFTEYTKEYSRTSIFYYEVDVEKADLKFEMLNNTNLKVTHEDGTLLGAVVLYNNTDTYKVAVELPGSKFTNETTYGRSNFTISNDGTNNDSNSVINGSVFHFENMNTMPEETIFVNMSYNSSVNKDSIPINGITQYNIENGILYIDWGYNNTSSLTLNGLTFGQWNQKIVHGLNRSSNDYVNTNVGGGNTIPILYYPNGTTYNSFNESAYKSYINRTTYKTNISNYSTTFVAYWNYSSENGSQTTSSNSPNNGALMSNSLKIDGRAHIGTGKTNVEVFYGSNVLKPAGVHNTTKVNNSNISISTTKTEYIFDEELNFALKSGDNELINTEIENGNLKLYSAVLESFFSNTTKNFIINPIEETTETTSLNLMGFVPLGIIISTYEMDENNEQLSQDPSAFTFKMISGHSVESFYLKKTLVNETAYYKYNIIEGFDNSKYGYSFEVIDSNSKTIKSVEILEPSGNILIKLTNPGQYTYRIKIENPEKNVYTYINEEKAEAIQNCAIFHGKILDAPTGEVLKVDPTTNAYTNYSEVRLGTIYSTVLNLHRNNALFSGKIQFSQAGELKNLPINMDGTFYLDNITPEVPFTISIVGGGSHVTTNYTLTLPENKIYESNLSLWRTLTNQNSGTRGIVYDNFGNPIPNATVSFYYPNGTRFSENFTSQGGVYAVYSTATNQEYYAKFQAQGYETREGTIVNPMHLDMTLDKLYNISVTVIDEETGSIVKSFSTYFGKNQTLKSTDNGTVEYKEVPGGSQELIIQAAGYNQITRELMVNEENHHFEIKVSKTDTSYYEPHVAQFSVRENKTGMLLKGVNVTVFSEGVQITSQKTGDDGSVSFKLAKYTPYKFVFSEPEREIHKEINLTPTNYLYVVYVDTNKDQTAFDYNYNRYIVFSELEAVYDADKISSIGFNSENTAVALRYSVYNHKNDNKMTESTVIRLIDKNKTETEITPDLRIEDGSTIHYYIQIPKETNIETGSTYKFTTVGSHSDAKDEPSILTKTWKVTFSSIKSGFNIFPGYEEYYTYIAVAILFILVGAIASFSTIPVTMLISFMATLFFVWTGWLNLPVSAIVFLFLAFIIYVFKKVYRGGD